MRKLLAVAARELRERWILFPAALVAGCFPLVLPAFGIKPGDAAFVGVFGAVCLGAAAAVVIGSSMLARDAADGRLGFLFARPLPWGTIWGGKWLAALVLAVSSGVLVTIPWTLFFPLSALGGRHGDSWLRAALAGPAPVFLILSVLGVGLANLGATAFRSRSPWLGLDLALLVAAIWATRRYVAPLWLYGVLDIRDPASLTAALAPLALAALVGSLPQVAFGRTDLHRAHRALSLGFWAVIGLTLIGAAGYWHAIRATGPDSVAVHNVTRDPAGRWVFVEGTGPHGGFYPHAFLIDTATGRYVARPGRDEGLEPVGGMLFSADGRFGVLPGVADAGAALDVVDLREAMPHMSRVTLESSVPPTWSTRFALSTDATSIFVVHASGASLYALPSGRRVATATIPPGWQPAAVRYPGQGPARAWLVPEGQRRAEMRIVDLSLNGASGQSSFPTAAAIDPALGWRTAVSPDSDGRRIVSYDAGLHLRDGATGALVATLVEGTAATGTLFLADGRIVVQGAPTEPASTQARLWVFDRVGTKLADVEVPLPPWNLGIGPEVAPGHVVVWDERTPYLPSQDTLLVDVASGQVIERLPGLRPAGGPSAATTSVHYFRSAEATVVHMHGGLGMLMPLVRIDFATGERTVVAGPGATRAERISAR